MSGKASDQVTLPEKRIVTRKQAPYTGSLYRNVLPMITIPSPLAKVMIGNQIERGVRRFGNAVGNGDNYQTITNGGDSW